jgi:alkanesulfonate monooxygenase SsuD/methylene tetrahydromethanopterin reductase-like flavin-dependent oxidoreductase (luciferase family)
VNDVPLSILELAPVMAGRQPAEALAYTTELARHAEQWAYRRDWVAEHHNMPAIASSAPAVLIAHLAAATSTIWLLGSSGFSAQLAGQLGLPFSFAHHFAAANTEPALELYRRSFRPSQWLDEAHIMVAVNAICADTDERAEALARPGQLSFLRLRQGRPIALPSVEDAAAYEFSDTEQEFVAQRRVRQALGYPATVREQLRDVLGRTGADELMLTNQIYNIKDRLRSYELIAELAR